MEPTQHSDTNLIQIDLLDLESILRENLGNEVIFSNIKNEVLLLKNQTGLGNLIKLKLTIKKNKNALEEDLHLIVKTVPKSKFHEMVVDTSLMVHKEIFTYKKIIPMYQKLKNPEWEEELTDMVPKTYGIRLSLTNNRVDDTTVLILEDLSQQGYKVSDVSLGVDLNHARLVVTSLSKFHALGIVCKHRNPQFYESSQIIIQKRFIKNTIQDLYDLYKNPERDVLSISRLKVYEDRIRESLRRGRKCGIEHFSDGDWSTIVHGDLWVNNILFHYNSHDQPDSVKFVDFQTITWSSFAYDLLYFLTTNCTPDVVTNDFEHLLDIYYESFSGTLQKMGLDIHEFNRISFNKDLDVTGRHMLFRTVHFLKFATTERIQDMDIDGLIESIDASIPSSAYEGRIYPVVKKFIDMGWI